jgi:hypothetical protein
MQICNCTVAIGGDMGMVVVKERVTVPELMILRAVHGDDAVRNIEVIDTVSMDLADERTRLQTIYNNPEGIVRDTVGVTGALPDDLFDSGIPDDFIINAGTKKSSRKKVASATEPLEVITE